MKVLSVASIIGVDLVLVTVFTAVAVAAEVTVALVAMEVPASIAFLTRWLGAVPYLAARKRRVAAVLMEGICNEGGVHVVHAVAVRRIELECVSVGTVDVDAVLAVVGPISLHGCAHGVEVNEDALVAVGVGIVV